MTEVGRPLLSQYRALICDLDGALDAPPWHRLGWSRAAPRLARLTHANAHHHRVAAALSSPTSRRLSAHTVSRLNHVRDTARKPNQR